MIKKGNSASKHLALQDLMLFRVHEILLVASPYDTFILEEDGRLTEQILNEYLAMNFYQSPRMWRVETGKSALELMTKRDFDVVIVMLRLADMDSIQLCSKIKRLYPDKPIILLIFDEYEIEERGMISASVFKKNKEFGNYKVLNDLVINNEVSRIIDLAIYAEGSHITTFKADGIIFSTPTGSTAYSLSAGGPIVHPTLPVTLITPICPHILTNRPLVVSNEMEITVKVLTEGSSYMTLDGRETIKVELNDEIKLKKSDSTVKLVKSPFRDYFSILKTKLMWGERYGRLNG